MDALGIALLVGQALDQSGVPYFLGGSMASSLQGEPRATNDLDFVADLSADRVAALMASLGEDFSVDEEALLEAIRLRRSCNFFYLPLLTKIDLFLKGRQPFDESEFSRRRESVVRGRPLWIKSPEDSVLRKLLWHRAGGEVSESQLRDVIHVLRLNAGRLDDAYLDRWARDLGLEAALARVRAAASRE